jgi:hypothetical protein
MANFKPKYNSINHETISPHLQASTHLNTPPILTSKVLILFQNMRKSITIAIVHKCFLPKLQLAIKGERSLIYTQMGGVPKEEGAWHLQGGRTMC